MSEPDSAPAENSVAPSFEDSLARLEAIVEAMESGDVTLADSLTLFEEGVSVSRACHEQLERAEQQVRVLLEQDGGLVERPFAGPSSAPAGRPPSSGQWRRPETLAQPSSMHPGAPGAHPSGSPSSLSRAESSLSRGESGGTEDEDNRTWRRR